jgi:hypothetical protein
MKQDLPKVFANKINKKLNNTQEIYYQDNFKNNNIHDIRSVNKKISDIFNSNNFVYKSNVKITTKDNIITKIIVGRKNNYLLTMDNEAININDIIDIEII